MFDEIAIVSVESMPGWFEGFVKSRGAPSLRWYHVGWDRFGATENPRDHLRQRISEEIITDWPRKKIIERPWTHEDVLSILGRIESPLVVRNKSCGDSWPIIGVCPNGVLFTGDRFTTFDALLANFVAPGGAICGDAVEEIEGY
jgi:hypothetical protein